MSEPLEGVRTAGAEPGGHGFGTAPVFLASVTTILGAIMFLRFGYAVADTGLAGSLMIIALGHLVTIPTALAVSEIATNRRVEGGGEYFIISRSFGSSIGGAIGLALFSSQAISIAFYMIAFAEAFRPVAPAIERALGLPFDVRLVSIPATLVLMIVVFLRGAQMGLRLLWLVAAVLLLALLAFFAGGPPEGIEVPALNPFRTVEDPDPFILVFAICFPAFTGMTAGVGLSGDLANPRRSIPLGVLTATAVGMVVYVLVVAKLALSAPPELLAADQLVMGRIAVLPELIPVGLACATLSSAIGSVLVAPRTLQALGRDGCIPFASMNRFVARGDGPANEPRNATLLTAVIALAVVAAGSVDFVARIISMFFMVTYGTLCLISSLEHFAARPSYRPSFRTRWYVSAFGALVSFLLMFQMDPLYAMLAIIVMIGINRAIAWNRRGESDDVAAILHGVMTQLTRTLHTTLQRTAARARQPEWRPSIVMVSRRSFDRAAPLQFLAWICRRYGFGTYLHHVVGQLDESTVHASEEAHLRLLRDAEHRGRGVYVDTMISPSMRSALAQTLQVPGVAGMENNTVMLEFSLGDGEEAQREVLDGCALAFTAKMNVLVLRDSEHFFGNRADVHVWLTWHDYDNASLMILLAYILLGHADWRGAEISIFAAFPEHQVAEQTARLKEMISAGRIPITEKKIVIIPTDAEVDFARLVASRSTGADLVILGFTEQRLHDRGFALLERHPSLRDVLFVAARDRIRID